MQGRAVSDGSLVPVFGYVPLSLTATVARYCSALCLFADSEPVTATTGTVETLLSVMVPPPSENSLCQGYPSHNLPRV